MGQAFCSAPRPIAEKRLQVAATIFPLVDIIRHVSGDFVKVMQILPAGASPHTFDLTPAQVRELQEARIIFKIGGVDDWIDAIANSLPQAVIVTLNRDIALQPLSAEGHVHSAVKDAYHEEFDPHYWLRADNGQIIARQISEVLGKIFPGRAESFRMNFADFSRELDSLHQELIEKLSGLKNNKMIVFHDAWRYFAAAYGLEIAAVFQSSPGREPTPRELRDLYSLVKKYSFKIIFSEPQLPKASIEPLLRDLGLQLVILDPLGGTDANDSYARMLRRNALAIHRALER